MMMLMDESYPLLILPKSERRGIVYHNVYVPVHLCQYLSTEHYYYTIVSNRVAETIHNLVSHIRYFCDQGTLHFPL